MTFAEALERHCRNGLFDPEIKLELADNDVVVILLEHPDDAKVMLEYAATPSADSDGDLCAQVKFLGEIEIESPLIAEMDDDELIENEDRDTDDHRPDLKFVVYENPDAATAQPAAMGQ